MMPFNEILEAAREQNTEKLQSILNDDVSIDMPDPERSFRISETSPDVSEDSSHVSEISPEVSEDSSHVSEISSDVSEDSSHVSENSPDVSEESVIEAPFPITLTPAAVLTLEGNTAAVNFLLEHGAKAVHVICALIKNGEIEQANLLKKQRIIKKEESKELDVSYFDALSMIAMTAAAYGYFDYAEDVAVEYFKNATVNHIKHDFWHFSIFIQKQAKEKKQLHRVDKLRYFNTTLKIKLIAEGALSSGNILYYMFLSCIYGDKANPDNTSEQNAEPRETDLNMLIITLSILSEARYPLEGMINNIKRDKNLNLPSCENQFLKKQAESITSHYSDGNENKSEEKEENTENSAPYMFFSSFQEKYEERNPSMLFFDGVAFRVAMSSLENISFAEENFFDSDSLERLKELHSIEDLTTLIAKYLFLGATVEDAHFSDNLKNAEKVLTTGDAPKLVMKSS